MQQSTETTTATYPTTYSDHKTIHGKQTETNKTTPGTTTNNTDTHTTDNQHQKTNNPPQFTTGRNEKPQEHIV